MRILSLACWHCDTEKTKSATYQRFVIICDGETRLTTTRSSVKKRNTHHTSMRKLQEKLCLSASTWPNWSSKTTAVNLWFSHLLGMPVEAVFVRRSFQEINRQSTLRGLAGTRKRTRHLGTRWCLRGRRGRSRPPRAQSELGLSSRSHRRRRTLPSLRPASLPPPSWAWRNGQS